MCWSTCRRTAWTTCAAASGLHAKTCPRSSTFGQEMFTSMASKPETYLSFWAIFTYSSTLLPAIDTMMRAPRCSSQARSVSINASRPGPWRPMELSMPLGVSAIRGVGRPARGCIMMLFVTIAPRWVMSKNSSSSRPDAAHPDAVRTGASSCMAPSEVDMSMRGVSEVTPIGPRPMMARLMRPPRPVRRRHQMESCPRRPIELGRHGRPGLRRRTEPSG